jgi:CheY-like chemotaxis protein
MTDKTGTTILVADDAPENVALLSRILKMNGYNVQVAENGAQAVESAIALHPDLILLDINMPVMDGFEASARLKENENTRDIPVIFVSALDKIEDKARAFSASAAWSGCVSGSLSAS